MRAAVRRAVDREDLFTTGRFVLLSDGQSKARQKEADAEDCKTAPVQ